MLWFIRPYAVVHPTLCCGSSDPLLWFIRPYAAVHPTLCCGSSDPMLWFIRPSAVVHPTLCCGSSDPMLWFIRPSAVVHPTLCCGSSDPMLWFIRPYAVVHPTLCCGSSDPMLWFIRPPAVVHPTLCCGSSDPMLWFIRPYAVVHPTLCCGSSDPLLWFIRPSAVVHPTLCCGSSDTFCGEQMWSDRREHAVLDNPSTVCACNDVYYSSTVAELMSRPLHAVCISLDPPDLDPSAIGCIVRWRSRAEEIPSTGRYPVPVRARSVAMVMLSNHFHPIVLCQSGQNAKWITPVHDREARPSRTGVQWSVHV